MLIFSHVSYHKNTFQNHLPLWFKLWLYCRQYRQVWSRKMWKNIKLWQIFYGCLHLACNHIAFGLVWFGQDYFGSLAYCSHILIPEKPLAIIVVIIIINNSNNIVNVIQLRFCHVANMRLVNLQQYGLYFMTDYVIALNILRH